MKIKLTDSERRMIAEAVADVLNDMHFDAVDCDESDRTDEQGWAEIECGRFGVAFRISASASFGLMEDWWCAGRRSYGLERITITDCSLEWAYDIQDAEDDCEDKAKTQAIAEAVEKELWRCIDRWNERNG